MDYEDEYGECFDFLTCGYDHGPTKNTIYKLFKSYNIQINDGLKGAFEDFLHYCHEKKIITPMHKCSKEE